MKNLINFFFSFDKLFKEKLVVPFFWLALIVAGLAFFAEALNSISLRPLANLIEFIGFFAEIFLVLISIRIMAEILVAIFRINDNLSPDGGRSELADIDPVAEARRAAELAASRTREMAKTAPKSSDSPKTDAKAKTATPTSKPADTKASAAASGGSMVKKAPDASKSEASTSTAADAKPATKTSGDAPKKRGPGRPKGSKNKTSAASGSSAIKRGPGRPKGSKNKTTLPGSTGSTGRSKPGPKPGTKVRRDADGNLLKKDGTPRKKPGPKPKSS